MDKFNSLFNSRRFWAALASIAVVLVQDKLPFTDEQITQFVMAVGAWIVGESLRSSESIGKIVRSVAVVAMLSIAMGSIAQAQIDMSYTMAKSLVGATTPRIIGDRIIIGEDSKPMVSTVAVIKVKSDERYKIKARKTLFETAELIALTDTEYMLAGEGEFLVEAMSVDHDATLKINLGPSPPAPPPQPPVPPEPPAPEPVKSFRVIFVKESGSTLPGEQTAIPGAKVIRDYLTAKTTPEGGLAGWREFDPQQNIVNEQPAMKALWAATKSSITAVPCTIVEVNGKATVLPFPKNVSDAIKILKEYGGQ